MRQPTVEEVDNGEGGSYCIGFCHVTQSHFVQCAYPLQTQ